MTLTSTILCYRDNMIKPPETLEQTLLDLVRQLPFDRQKQVVDFVRFLGHEARQNNDEDNLLITGFDSLKTQLSNLEKDISKEELDNWLTAFDKA